MRAKAEAPIASDAGACRYCGEKLLHTFIDLGMSPPCESVRRREDMDAPEVFYPLHVYLCDHCWLVQLREYLPPAEIFTEYAYFSSTSDSWLAHARFYVESMIHRFELDRRHQVVEIASNDGYLLQNFVRHDIPSLGIEPAANVAKIAEAKGVRSIVRFFGLDTASELVRSGIRADLLIGNNVLAHVPDINDFVGGLKVLLAEEGVITMEFPHLLRLMEQKQFDTIYHEHYSYLSLLTVERIFEGHGLRLFDVEELATHGGSLRIFATHREANRHLLSPRLTGLREQEQQAGMNELSCYASFGQQVEKLKLDILSFFIEAKRAGKTIAGYGAPGKGVTLLNYCGIRADFLSFTVDRNVYKQGSYVPGTGIPIYEPEHIRRCQPDYVFILPWNLKEEIMQQMQDIRDWGGRFVVPIPELQVI